MKLGVNSVLFKPFSVKGLSIGLSLKSMVTHLQSYAEAMVCMNHRLIHILREI